MTQPATAKFPPHDRPIDNRDEAEHRIFTHRRIPFTSADFVLFLVEAAVFVALLIWTWNRMGDVAIDYGRDPYLAWQIGNGRALYTDLSYLFGPLSPHVNALLFAIFGASSLRVLTFCNLGLLVIVTLVMRYILRRIADRLTATIGVLLFLVFCGFNDLTPLANFNYITPYAHAATHGFSLCLFAIACLIAYARSGASYGWNVWLVVAGACIGLTVLTKPEIALAAMAVSVVGVPLVLWGRRQSFGDNAISFSLFVGSAILAPLIVLILIARNGVTGGTPWPDLIAGTFRSYALSGDPRVLDMPLYRDGMGFDFVERSAIKLVTWACLYLQLFLPAVILAIVIRKQKGQWRWLLALAMAIGVSWFVWRWPITAKQLRDSLRGVPLLAMFFAICTFIPIRAETRYNGRLSPKTIGRVIFAVFAIAMLARMPLYFRIAHYGFIQAVPAILLCTMAMMCWLPEWMRARGYFAPMPRLVAIGLVVGLVGRNLASDHEVLKKRTVRLHTIDPHDSFLINNDYGDLINEIIDQLNNRAQPFDTLAVLPEGAVINLAVRMPNPTPHDVLDPLNIMAVEGGEARVLQNFKRTPPTWIIVMHHPMNHMNAEWFGKDYCADLGAWIKQNYEVAHQAGLEPNTDQRFYGIQLLQRRSGDVSNQPP